MSDSCCRCYYCGRSLVSGVPLSREKTTALYANQLTCGPCVHVHGRLPWRWEKGPGQTQYRLRRYRMRESMKDAA
jgi:hypothetical protein